MELPLQYEGRIAGVLRTAEQEGETCFEVTLTEAIQGVCRIIARGERGELLLGVVETGQRVLRRRFSNIITGKAGKLHTVRAEKSGAPRQDWRAVGEGEFPMLPHLPHTALCRTAGKRHCLALPWGMEEPFPLVELFCFARIRTMRGRNWVVFTFDEGGMPVL